MSFGTRKGFQSGMDLKLLREQREQNRVSIRKKKREMELQRVRRELNSKNMEQDMERIFQKQQELHLFNKYENSLTLQQIAPTYFDEFQFHMILFAVATSNIVNKYQVPYCLIFSIVAYSFGDSVNCCARRDLNILPSQAVSADYYWCCHCNKKSCSYRCRYCVEQENELIWSDEGYPGALSRSINIPIGPEYCIACRWEHVFNQKLCMNCVFLCSGCHAYFCTLYHLNYICPNCDGKYCTKEEDDSIICNVCHVKSCWKCQWVYNDNGFSKGWDHIGKLYKICCKCYTKRAYKKIISLCPEVASKLPGNVLYLIKLYQ